MRISLGHSHRRGIALIIVMLVILVLAVLAAGFAFSMKVEMRLARNAHDESNLEWVGRSGVALARYVVAQQTRVPNQGSFAALNQKWAGGPGDTNGMLAEISLQNNRLGAATFSVKITDRERKFNINAAPEPVLQQALHLVGLDAGAFPAIVDSIIDWRDPDNLHRLSGAETDYYRTMNPPYAAKNGPIDDIQELLMIRGITPEIFWGPAVAQHPHASFQPLSYEGRNSRYQPEEPLSFPVGLIDIFSTMSSGKLNINTANQTTLQMIPDVDETTAAAIIQLRAGPDGADGTEDDTPFHSPGELINVPGMSRQAVAALQQLCDVQSHTFDVEVDTELDGFKRKYIALIRRSPSNFADLQVLSFYWQ
jgi:general secretion pathway protein K